MGGAAQPFFFFFFVSVFGQEQSLDLKLLTLLPPHPGNKTVGFPSTTNGLYQTSSESQEAPLVNTTVIASSAAGAAASEPSSGGGGREKWGRDRWDRWWRGDSEQEVQGGGLEVREGGRGLREEEGVEERGRRTGEGEEGKKARVIR